VTAHGSGDRGGCGSGNVGRRFTFAALALVLSSRFFFHSARATCEGRLFHDHMTVGTSSAQLGFNALTMTTTLDYPFEAEPGTADGSAIECGRRAVVSDAPVRLASLDQCFGPSKRGWLGTIVGHGAQVREDDGRVAGRICGALGGPFYGWW